MQIKKQLYSSQIIDVIKNDLLIGKLSPGDKVNEAQLSHALGISRGPIREALSLLEKDGLVISTPQIGKSIVLLSTKEIVDNYLVGAILEGKGIAQTCNKFTETDFETLQSIILQMGDTSNSYEDRLKLDEDFHNTLLRYVDNATLVTTSRQFSRKISKFLLLKYWKNSSEPADFQSRHIPLLKIVASRNPQAIEEGIYTHYNELALNIISQIEN